MADRWAVYLRNITVNGHPAGPSIVRVMRRILASPPGADVLGQHRRRMATIHQAYRRRRRTW